MELSNIRVFNYDIRIEFFTCFSHTADVKYRGKDTGHKKHSRWIGDIVLISGIRQFF